MALLSGVDCILLISSLSLFSYLMMLSLLGTFRSVLRTSSLYSSFSTNSTEVIDNTGSYKSIKYEIADYRNRMLNHSARFQPISKREDRSVYQIPSQKAFATGKYIARYRDSFVMKTPIDQMTLIQLLQDVKPQTIIELGTFLRGSTLLMDDIMSKTLDDYRIYSLDIDSSLEMKLLTEPYQEIRSFSQVVLMTLITFSHLTSCPILNDHYS